jgi:hypothetical protein
MPWKLIIQLSMFGLLMGVATVFWIPPNVEPILWILIFVFCAVRIGRVSDQPFVSGVLLGLANSVWITACHVLLFSKYLETHPREAAMMKTMLLPDSPRAMMAMVGPVVGLISGVVIGILAFLCSKFFRARLPAV